MSENRTPNARQSESTDRSAVPQPWWRQGLEWAANQSAFAVMAVCFAMGFAANRIPLLDPFDDLFFLLGGVLPLLLGTISTSEDGYRADVSNGERLRFLVSQLRWAVTPWGLYTQLLQVVGTVTAYLRYLGRLPNRQRHVPETTVTAPFGGQWTTVNGGVTKPTSHSWGIVSQRYAYDFVVTDEEGDTHENDGAELTDYYAYGEPIQAPAAGTVVKAKDGLRDYPSPGSSWTEWRTWDIAGNHVVIEHEPGEYSFLAHLKADSLRVEPGDEVTRGEVVAECGNSGISTEPHLHYQLQEHRTFWFAAGLVPQFDDVAIDREDDRRTDHDVYVTPDASDDPLWLWAGDRVRPATDDGGENRVEA